MIFISKTSIVILFVMSIWGSDNQWSLKVILEFLNTQVCLSGTTSAWIYHMQQLN